MVRFSLSIDTGVRRSLLAAIVIAPAWWIDAWSRYHGMFLKPTTQISIALLFAQAAVVMLTLVALVGRRDRWSLIAALGIVGGYAYGWRGHPQLGVDALASMAPFGFVVAFLMPLAWTKRCSQPPARRRQFTVRALLGALVATGCFLAALRSQQQVELEAVPLWLPLLLLTFAYWGRCSIIWRGVALLAALLAAPLAGSVAYASIFLRSGISLATALESTIAMREWMPYGVIARRWLFGPDSLYDQAWSLGYSAALSTPFAWLGFAVLRLNGLMRVDRESQATDTLIHHGDTEPRMPGRCVGAPPLPPLSKGGVVGFARFSTSVFLCVLRASAVPLPSRHRHGLMRRLFREHDAQDAAGADQGDPQQRDGIQRVAPCEPADQP